jgi:hypothetical protein
MRHNGHRHHKVIGDDTSMSVDTARRLAARAIARNAIHKGRYLIALFVWITLFVWIIGVFTSFELTIS